jgi:hypothetical protein
LPRVGYWGEGDVCLGDWAVELHRARAAVTAAADGVHIYDEGEQSQPAYEFRRSGPSVLISVIEGSGGGEADPDWQQVACDLTDFVAATADFEESLRATVAVEAGEAGRAWFQFAMRYA